MSTAGGEGYPIGSGFAPSFSGKPNTQVRFRLADIGDFCSVRPERSPLLSYAAFGEILYVSRSC